MATISNEVTPPGVEEVNYFSYDQISYGDAGAKETEVAAVDTGVAWGATEDWNEQKFEDTNPPAPTVDLANPQSTADQHSNQVTDVDGGQNVVKAIVLYLFSGENDDELAVSEHEEVFILVKECDEEGWVMAQNLAGKKGLVPSSFVQVLEPDQMDDFSPSPAAGMAQSMETQQPSLVIPSCPPPDVDDDFSSDEDSDDEDEDDDLPPPGRVTL